MAREWIGRLDGSTNVEIRARVSGYIERIDFLEGHLVKKGDLLLRIDTRPLDASLAQARAEVAKAVATQEKADIDEKRLKPLLASKAVSQQDYDNAVQFNLAAKAGLEAARAVEQQAKLNLEYATITSPLDGIVGRTDFNVGDFLSAGSAGAPVTTVSTVDPIKLIFSASEKDYLNAADRIEKMLRMPEAERQKEARSELIRADGKMHEQKGWFVAADREVDAKTGTIRISSYFPNPGNVLRPGQYARVRIPADEKGKGLIVIPQRAVVELQGKSFVWVADAANKVTQRPVVPGVLVGSDSVIEEGLQAGERIVTEGVQKLREGMTVTPVEPAKP
jgi:membrane fusion protein (multidrug efflux system)